MIRYALAAALLLVAPSAVAEQGGHTATEQMHHDTAQATEPGQSAFAAIREIVGILRDDPDTDWSAVDIDALRRHLVDMDNVTLRADAETVPLDNGVRYEVTGDDGVRASIRRMVAAHVAAMDDGGAWRYRAEERPAGAAMTVTVAEPADPVALARLRGLGFFGVMALGMHHQAHHLAIARGGMPHR